MPRPRLARDLGRGDNDDSMEGWSAIAIAIAIARTYSRAGARVLRREARKIGGKRAGCIPAREIAVGKLGVYLWSAVHV